MEKIKWNATEIFYNSELSVLEYLANHPEIKYFKRRDLEKIPKLHVLGDLRIALGRLRKKGYIQKYSQSRNKMVFVPVSEKIANFGQISPCSQDQIKE